MLHGLAWASYVAGMEAPGLHGLLAGVTLTLMPPTSDAEGGAFVVRDVDERTGRVLVGSVLCSDGFRIAVDVEAFLLEPPRTPNVDALRPGEGTPRGESAAVVVGASRGLGAAMLLAFAFRGCDVHGVYASSAVAAEDVRTLAGEDGDRIVLHQADAGDGPAMQEIARAVEARGRGLETVVLAAALPPVPTALAGDGTSYLTDYVAASLRLVAVPLAALLPLLDDDGTVVFCSSTAVVEPPRDWPQYVAAKGAIEALAAWVATTHPGLSTIVVRLPKLATDMSNTPAGRMGASATEPIASRLAEAALAHGFEPGLNTLDVPAEAAR
jgi:NAD(P)-dependent dehydrogenase (short-subunit alcohol dehydrogenase family)